jgi:hypothetical protein
MEYNTMNAISARNINPEINISGMNNNRDNKGKTIPIV